MTTYLVTGGCGFIGSNFIRFLLNKYDDVKIVNLDALTYAGNLENLSEYDKDERYVFMKGSICDEKTVEKLFDEYDADFVVNFAAESHVDRSIKMPMIFVETNVKGTAVLLNAAKKAWQTRSGFKSGKKYLQVSTDEVYGALGKTGMFCETTPLNPHSPYSASKASADMLTKAYFDTFGLPVNITRCSNNYGPYQFPEKLIPLVYNNCLTGKNIPVYGDGLQIRDWLYVEDHCKAIDLVLNKAECGEIYNIGGHNEKTNIFIVESIIDYVKKNVENSCSKELIVHVADRLGHDKRYAIDPSKITKDLGWKPETKFEDGIIKTLNWYKDNSEWMKRVINGDYRAYYKSQYGDN
ncbi:MAG: dTDP-glucose 4,6-dehydratase [Firmicutes bacterium]|nr:dTDP-glucose 4,6-dehydratase [Bacillota bacterium]